MVVQPGTRLGPYEILSLLGAGGMGQVYRARDPRLGREVAIKTIAPHLAAEPDALARFQREARAIAALSHPNILAIHDLGTQDDVWFLVTELLEGETLRERLSGAALPWRTAVDIAVAVAEGLTGAHARGIVHRDLKPENVFLTSDRRVKILDFGLVRHAPALAGSAETGSPTLSASTEPGRLVGTVGYMSPEQIQGRPPDARSDIFSLGCVVHEMLSGRRLFHKATDAETLAAILKDAPPALSECGTAVPAELEHVVLQCLEKNRDERFQSARDLAFALRAIFSSTTPTAGSSERPSLPSVAVLPFLNLSADPENAFFADGVTEDVIAHLSKIRSLKVISRTSVMSFQKRDRSLREIGSLLGTATILEGSVRRVGNRVRIVAQLVDVETDARPTSSISRGVTVPAGIPRRASERASRTSNRRSGVTLPLPWPTWVWPGRTRSFPTRDFSGRDRRWPSGTPRKLWPGRWRSTTSSGMRMASWPCSSSCVISTGRVPRRSSSLRWS